MREGDALDTLLQSYWRMPREPNDGVWRGLRASDVRFAAGAEVDRHLAARRRVNTDNNGRSSDGQASVARNWSVDIRSVGTTTT